MLSFLGCLHHIAAVCCSDVRGSLGHHDEVAEDGDSMKCSQKIPPLHDTSTLKMNV
jgi:hypothetical protein